MSTTTIETSVGVFTARFSERGLAGLNFPVANGKRPSAKMAGTAWTPQLRRWHAQTAAALRAALAGKQPAELPPLDLSNGSEFQRRIWNELLRIAPGQTRTYAQVAAAAGRPRASRAVGGACGANPIPVFVPCHRVVAARGKLGGFSCGLEFKRLLLQREGVALL